MYILYCRLITSIRYWRKGKLFFKCFPNPNLGSYDPGSYGILYTSNPRMVLGYGDFSCPQGIQKNYSEVKSRDREYKIPTELVSFNSGSTASSTALKINIRRRFVRTNGTHASKIPTIPTDESAFYHLTYHHYCTALHAVNHTSTFSRSQIRST